ncbi:MAG: ABC transporter permease [Termitinemataceae bacterium]|nr:MAG: ABC transporter permease [Termitinemataceae bacterium]
MRKVLWCFPLFLYPANINIYSMALFTFLFGPWISLYFAGNTLDFFALLLCTSAGALITFRAGLFNIGLDGQIYIGGLSASVVILFLPDTFPAFFVLLIAAFAATASGFFMGGICGVLKKAAGASEIITTFLLSSALIPFVDYVINNFLRDDSGNLLSSRQFLPNFILPHLFSTSNLSISFFIALSFPLILFIFLNKTKSGYRFRIAGDSPQFALFGGIETDRYWVPALGLGGALGGLAGFFAVAGTYGQCYQGFTGGLGWAAIAVALISAGKPLMLIPAALFYAWLKEGTESVLLSRGVFFETSTLIQALILLLITVKVARFHRCPKKEFRTTNT